MSHDCNDIPNSESEANSFSLSDSMQVTFHYESKAVDVDSNLADADTPIIVCNGDPLEHAPPESESVVTFSYEGKTNDSGAYQGRYTWIGRELDTDFCPAIQPSPPTPRLAAANG